MPKVKALCTFRFTDAQLDALRSVSSDLELRQQVCRNPEELTAALDPQVEVLYTFLSPSCLQGASGLRWVQLHSAGADHLPGTALWETGVLITSANGVHRTAIAEYVMASALAFSRRLPLMLHYQHRAEWPPKRWERFQGRELRGSTFCIVGYGSIGREVARQARCFGARVLAVKGNPAQLAETCFRLPGTGDPDGTLPETVYGPSGLGKALEQSDYVVLAVPSTASTRRLIGEPELRAMQSHAYLINVARGSVVDQEALVRALEEGWIGGAGLDVFEPEPLPAESPLWRLENVILSPHVAGFTPLYVENAALLFAENLKRYLGGEPLLNMVDRKRGY